MKVLDEPARACKPTPTVPGPRQPLLHLPARHGKAPGPRLFRTIDRPRRVAFATTETAPFATTETASDGTSFDLDVEIAFEGRDGKALMTVVQRGFPSAEVRDLHGVGQPNAFDRLARFVRARVPGPFTKGRR